MDSKEYGYRRDKRMIYQKKYGIKESPFIPQKQQKKMRKTTSKRISKNMENSQKDIRKHGKIENSQKRYQKHGKTLFLWNGYFISMNVWIFPKTFLLPSVVLLMIFIVPVSFLSYLYFIDSFFHWFPICFYCFVANSPCSIFIDM